MDTIAFQIHFRSLLRIFKTKHNHRASGILVEILVRVNDKKAAFATRQCCAASRQRKACNSEIENKECNPRTASHNFVLGISSKKKLSFSFDTSNLSNPKPIHTMGRPGRSARRGSCGGSGKIGCQQNHSPWKQKSKKRRFKVPPQKQRVKSYLNR